MLSTAGYGAYGCAIGDAKSTFATMSTETFRRATNLELFLDLVFVFAVAQMTTMLAQGLTPEGVSKALLLMWLVWWLWSQFTWAGSGVDFERHAPAQITVLFTIPPTLVMAVAIPNAMTTTGPHFGIAYLLVQGCALAILQRSMRHTKERQQTFYAYAGLASIGPVLVAAGGLAEGNVRLALWIAAALAGIGGALGSGTRRPHDSRAHHWTIDPGHFSERHALFVIIVLGELLVAVGANVSVDKFADSLVALGVAAGLACVMWWMYFAYIPKVTEHALAATPPHERGTLARDMFSFGHFPIVVGVVAAAVVVKHMVKHPYDPMARADQVMLTLSIASFIAGFMAIHWRNNRGVAVERPITAALLVVTDFAVGRAIPSVAMIAIVAVAYLAMHAVTVHLLPKRYEQ